jgi:hypothetical protein
VKKEVVVLDLVATAILNPDVVEEEEGIVAELQA